MITKHDDEGKREVTTSPFERRITVAFRAGLVAAVVVFAGVGAYAWSRSGSSVSQLLDIKQLMAFWFSSRQAVTPLVGLIAFLVALRTGPRESARPPVRSSAIGGTDTRPELRPRVRLVVVFLGVFVLVAWMTASLSSDVGQGPELVVTLGSTTSTVASSGGIFAGLVVVAAVASALLLRHTIIWAAYAPASGRTELAIAEDAARLRLMKIIEAAGRGAAAVAVGITLWSAGGGFASAAATPISGACDAPSSSAIGSVCHETLRYAYVQPVYGIAVAVAVIGALVCVAGLATLVRTHHSKARPSSRTEYALDHRR